MRSDPLAYLTAELTTLKAQGLYRKLRVLEDEQKPKTTFDHRSVVNLSSNNYLCLTTHPRHGAATKQRYVALVPKGEVLAMLSRRPANLLGQRLRIKH